MSGHLQEQASTSPCDVPRHEGSHGELQQYETPPEESDRDQQLRLALGPERESQGDQSTEGKKRPERDVRQQSDLGPKTHLDAMPDTFGEGRAGPLRFF